MAEKYHLVSRKTLYICLSFIMIGYHIYLKSIKDWTDRHFSYYNRIFKFIIIILQNLNLSFST